MDNQNVAVLIDFTGGSLEQGLTCKASVLVDGAVVEDRRTEFRLPPNSVIEQKYFQWQGSRDIVEKLRNAQGVFPDNTRQESVRALSHSKDIQRDFEKTLRKWFSSKEFESLRLWILGQGANYFKNDRSIPIIFDFGTLEQKKQLQKLPWQLWDLLGKHFAKSEAVMAADYSKSLGNLQFPVKILAVFGSDEGGLDFQNEIQALEALNTSSTDSPGNTQQDNITSEKVKIEVLKEPSFDELCDQLIENRWDILLFSGHSNTEQDFRESKLKINRNIVIEIGDLRDQFRFAIDNGLKLAIFNSCDGLGIASYLSEEIGAKVPSIIVMKEPVYDIAASRFFVQFFHTIF